MGQKADSLRENRIHWEQHAFPLLLAITATGYALLNYKLLPEAIGIYLPFGKPVPVFIARWVVTACYLGIIWTLQTISILQTRRWIANEVKKCFNIKYIILASAVIYFSFLAYSGILDALFKGSIVVDLSLLEMILSAILPFVNERHRLFIPKGIAQGLPEPPTIPYIERSHELEWVTFLICLSAFPVILLAVITKIPLFCSPQGLFPRYCFTVCSHRAWQNGI